MPTLAVQLAIGDYAKWRPVFDKHKPLRDKAGLTNVRHEGGRGRACQVHQTARGDRMKLAELGVDRRSIIILFEEDADVAHFEVVKRTYSGN
jgi:hypothetical protein